MSRRFTYYGVPTSLLPNLIAYYAANDNALDSHINGLNGSFINAAYAAGIEGQAFNYGSGTETRYVNVPSNPLLSFTDGIQDLPFTINTWVWFDGVSSVGNWFINKRDNINQIEWQMIRLSSTNELQFWKFSLGTSIYVQARTPFLPTFGQWYMLTYTDDGSILGGQWYVNGIAQTMTYTNTGYIRMQAGTNLMRLGISAWGVDLNTKHRGRQDATAIFNKQLSAAEVSDLWNAGSGKFYPNI
jgi:hypothetical protein